MELTGTWNVWDGGATYGRVTQAKAQLMQSKNNYDNGIRQVVLDVQQAISNLQQAQETIDSQTASVVQATEALRLSKERLDAGAGTQLDVLNAQVQLLQAQSNVLQARFDYIAAMSSYELALSLDTQYVETFEDPLVRPLNPQALNKTERTRFPKGYQSRQTAGQASARIRERGSDRADLARRAAVTRTKAEEKEDICRRTGQEWMKAYVAGLGRAKLRSTDRHLRDRSRVAAMSGGILSRARRLALPASGIRSTLPNDRCRDGSRDGSWPPLVGPSRNGKCVGILRHAIRSCRTDSWQLRGAGRCA